MNRKRSTDADMRRARRKATSSPLVIDEASIQVHPGLVLVNGCESVRRTIGQTVAKEPGNVSQMVEVSIREERRQVLDVDFNDRFPDEILLHIFQYIWRPADSWNAAKVCKRWCTLLACNQLQKRSNHDPGHYPCMGHYKDTNGRSKMTTYCNGSSKMLKLKKVESEWRLAMDFLTSCKRHTHSLEMKDCNHLSVKGYQLTSGFGSNLKSIRLESCNTLDDPSFDSILVRCSSLRSIHLSMVPNLALRNMEKKAPKQLEELHVYGCRLVTASTVMSVLRGCPNLKSLCLSAMGVAHDYSDKIKFAQVPPLNLQTLELSNTFAVTDGFLQALSEGLSNLRRLDLTNCPLLTDDGFKHMISHCGNRLLKLVVTRCPEISDNSVRALADVAANLRDLSLAGTNISDNGLQALMESRLVTSKLRNLSVARCLRVTDAGLQHIILRRRQLVSFNVFDIQGCPKISAFGLWVLRATMNEKRRKLGNLKMITTEQS